MRGRRRTTSFLSTECKKGYIRERKKEELKFFLSRFCLSNFIFSRVGHYSFCSYALFRSDFTDEKQIPSWIAHGTLLGWWWGGSFLPWDSDIDVQMNANFLYVLARFNNTVLSDRYLVDV